MNLKLKAYISRLEYPGPGKACYARLHSYSRLKKREPLIALGLPSGEFLISASTVPHSGTLCGANKLKKKKRKKN